MEGREVKSPRTIGLLGGMSWKSSVEYERMLNEAVRDRLGGTHSASLVVRSFNFAPIDKMMQEGRWDDAGALLSQNAARLEAAGAEMIILCTNTLHRVAEDIEAAISVPFLHLADTTADAALAADVSSVLLLGTRFTMEQDFYRRRLEAKGLQVLVPDEDDRTRVHDIIFDELVQGVFRPESKQAFLDIIAQGRERGAQGVIAGCTEIEQIVTADDVDCAFFPTAALHAQAAAEWSLAGL